MRRSGFALVLLVAGWGCTDNSGDKFIGKWQSIQHCAEFVTILKQSDFYIIRDENGRPPLTCQLTDGLLKCGDNVSVGFAESSGTIMGLNLGEMKKVAPEISGCYGDHSSDR